MYAEKTPPPWAKRATSDKYNVEAVRAKVPVSPSPKKAVERV